MEHLDKKGSSMASWSTFMFKKEWQIKTHKNNALLYAKKWNIITLN